ncbi:hypothetical protein [Sinorhizobium meliloti]|uniref:hypothetical protein n=1 Tax=Rhizobium meliloti TaxID=382 RepID=UPI001F361339|nr:hypothetical protein [Sinorhizobium meliloti]MCM5693982.1 hypothetical protein [Sinorhizobium meliloti]
MKVRDALVNEFAGSERKLRAIARQDENAQRLMTTPGVGVLVALSLWRPSMRRGASAHPARWGRTSD